MVVQLMTNERISSTALNYYTLLHTDTVYILQHIYTRTSARNIFTADIKLADEDLMKRMIM